MEWGEALGKVVSARRMRQRSLMLESWGHPENFGNFSELVQGEGGCHGYLGSQKVSRHGLSVENSSYGGYEGYYHPAG
jgi:hypothetical protein